MSRTAPELHAIHGSDLFSSLHLSQQAPLILNRRLTSETNLKSTLLLSPEKFEEYREIEQLLLACLQTGDDRSALSCLNQLEQRFGASNERVLGLRGIYEEAVAEDQSSLESCLRKYDTLLLENPANMPVLKRRVALLRALSRPTDAIHSLIDLLKAAPTDAEACTLPSIRREANESFVVPDQIHARLGELQHLVAGSSDPEQSYHLLRGSIRSFSRSIELCDDYLRGFYGLASASSALLKGEGYRTYLQDSSLSQADDSLSVVLLERLSAFAKTRIEGIVKERSKGRIHSEYSQGELIAAKELLDRLNLSD
ncbi:hypothetical protein LV164_003082 [Aspergillus fumigatus]|nr:hypothetical protein KXX42_005958 [Aspergillus fumigatus]KAH1541806.1 hypothetical protein KXX57_006255 [Aspergillus fumigatus]KAH1984881.1 hypothetical protein KXW88_001546 [Aspergillus fumigatus]KAH2651591.1 hypothetical protein KXV32_004398 [Aspergillus fumigatus]KAH3133816.1 hypothetical protein KXW18_006818 [Aspergillus fumigatus]